MAEVALGIFGVVVPVVQGLIKLHDKLEAIRGAPADIKMFKSETKLLALLVKNFQTQCPASLQKMAEPQRQEALAHAKAFVKHFHIVKKLTDAAGDVILRTFDSNMGALEQLFAHILWTFRKSAIAEARDSMRLFVGMINMFNNALVAESLLYQNTRLRERKASSSRELQNKLNFFGGLLKRDRAHVRGALRQYAGSSTGNSNELQSIEQTVKSMDGRATRVLFSLPSSSSSTGRQSRYAEEASRSSRQPGRRSSSGAQRAVSSRWLS